MAVTASLFVLPRAMTFDGNGHAQGGALMGFYLTGTTTPQPVYADSGLTTPLSNPVVADANGLFPAIYMPANTLYKAVLQTAALATVWTTDPIEGVPLSTTPAVGLLVNYLSGLNTSRNVGTPNTKIDVAAGACTDSTNTLAMLVSAGTIDTGTVGANGLDTGILLASRTYHYSPSGKRTARQPFLHRSRCLPRCPRHTHSIVASGARTLIALSTSCPTRKTAI